MDETVQFIICHAMLTENPTQMAQITQIAGQDVSGSSGVPFIFMVTTSNG